MHRRLQCRGIRPCLPTLSDRARVGSLSGFWYACRSMSPWFGASNGCRTQMNPTRRRPNGARYAHTAASKHVASWRLGLETETGRSAGELFRAKPAPPSGLVPSVRTGLAAGPCSDGHAAFNDWCFEPPRRTVLGRSATKRGHGGNFRGSRLDGDFCKPPADRAANLDASAQIARSFHGCPKSLKLLTRDAALIVESLRASNERMRSDLRCVLIPL